MIGINDIKGLANIATRFAKIYDRREGVLGIHERYQFGKPGFVPTVQMRKSALLETAKLLEKVIQNHYESETEILYLFVEYRGATFYCRADDDK